MNYKGCETCPNYRIIEFYGKSVKTCYGNVSNPEKCVLYDKGDKNDKANK